MKAKLQFKVIQVTETDKNETLSVGLFALLFNGESEVGRSQVGYPMTVTLAAPAGVKPGDIFEMQLP